MAEDFHVWYRYHILMSGEIKMKRIILPIFIFTFCLSSCNFLERLPKDKIDPNDFFRTEEDLKLFSNSFYDNLFEKQPFKQQSDVFVQKGTLSDELLGGDARMPIPVTGGGWSWGQLRKINTMLGNMHKCEDPKVARQYSGLAKFFRAQFYFTKVARFGDVPWYDRELDSTDPELYKPRDSREFIMTKMLEDIDEAIETLPEAVSTYRANRWAALALKAQFCLYEGTYRKYHKLNIEGHDSDYYLDLAAKAAEEIMTKGPYSLASSYDEMFRQVVADKNEYILAIRRDLVIDCTHDGTSFCLMATGGCPGFTKKFVDSFLMKDGTRFTDKENYETMPFVDEMANRDPRLGLIMRLPSYVRSTEKYMQRGPQLNLTGTGFQYDKFVMSTAYPEAESKASMAYNDIPVFRLGEIYLIYAEAKAELGTLTQQDVEISINKLRRRVGMTPMTLSSLTVDPYLTSAETGYKTLAEFGHPNLAAVLEIRRERTIELALEGRRWDDIVRWREGNCYRQKLYGIYFQGPGQYDLNGDDKPDVCLYDTKDKPVGLPDNIICLQIQEIEINGSYVSLNDGIILSEGRKGYLDMHKFKKLDFNENRDYLYPIPTNERTVNPALAQNPGWNDGLSF